MVSIVGFVFSSLSFLLSAVPIKQLSRRSGQHWPSILLWPAYLTCGGEVCIASINDLAVHQACMGSRQNIALIPLEVIIPFPRQSIPSLCPQLLRKLHNIASAAELPGTVDLI